MNFEGKSYIEQKESDGGGGGVDLSDIYTRLVLLEGKTKNIVDVDNDITNFNGYIVQNPSRELISTANDTRIGTGELADKFYVNRRSGFGMYYGHIDSAMTFDAGRTTILYPTMIESGGQGVEFEAGVLVATMNGVYIVTISMELTNFAKTVHVEVDCQDTKYVHSILPNFDVSDVSATFTCMFPVFSR